jgi:hypothetical protein
VGDACAATSLATGDDDADEDDRDIMNKSEKMMDTVPMMTNFLAELSRLLDELSQLQDKRVLLLV